MTPRTTDSKTSRLSKIFNLRKPSISSSNETPSPSLSIHTPTSSTTSTPTKSIPITRAAFIPSLQLDLGQSFNTDAVIAHVEEVKKEREEQAKREKEARAEKERVEKERVEFEKRERVEFEKREKEAVQREAWEREVMGRRFYVPGGRRRDAYRKSGFAVRRRGF